MLRQTQDAGRGRRWPTPSSTRDRNPPVYDPKAKTVTMPRGLQDGPSPNLMDSGFWRLDLPEHIGGIAAPPVGALGDRRDDPRRQPRASTCTCPAPASPASCGDLGNEEQKRMGRRSWSSASGAPPWCSPSPMPARTSARASPRPTRSADGSWHIEGVKRFITSRRARHEREHHPPRAGPPGRRRGRGRPRHQGPEPVLRAEVSTSTPTGNLGERNGAFVTNVEKKMGLKVSTTCEVTLRPTASRRRAGWSATCTTASRRCSRSSSTPA